MFKVVNLSIYKTGELVMGPSGGRCNFATISSNPIRPKQTSPLLDVRGLNLSRRPWSPYNT